MLIAAILLAVLQERIKALIDERKKLLEGGGAEGGSSSQSHGGKHPTYAPSTPPIRLRLKLHFYVTEDI